MKYQILFTSRAKKDLLKLSSSALNRVDKALRIMADSPQVGKLLRGQFKGMRSHRVGDYRIIYQIERAKIIIIVLTIGHRRQVYRS